MNEYFIEPRADTQCGLVLACIRLHGYITDRKALEFGCRRLASRIHDLNKNGADIIAIRETKNGVHFARYMFREAYEKDLKLSLNAELAGQPTPPKMKPFWQNDYAKYAQVI